MKSMLIVGGVLGFGSGFAFSLIHRESWLACLEHGGASALLTGSLLQWWALAWADNFTETVPVRSNAVNLLSISTQPNTFHP